MDSLKSLAAKVKSSPQVKRKIFARPYDRGSYFKASEEENSKGRVECCEMKNFLLAEIFVRVSLG